MTAPNLNDMREWLLANAQQSRRPEYGDLILAALDELEEQRQRNALFSDCLHRANLLWQEQHPEADFWPDGAKNLAWLMEQYTALQAERADLRTLLARALGNLSALCTLAGLGVVPSGDGTREMIAQITQTLNLGDVDANHHPELVPEVRPGD